MNQVDSPSISDRGRARHFVRTVVAGIQSINPLDSLKKSGFRSLSSLRSLRLNNAVFRLFAWFAYFAVIIPGIWMQRHVDSA